MGGYDHLMEKRKPRFYLRPEKIKRAILPQRIFSTKLKRPLIFCRNIIRMTITFWFMIMPPLT
jgi:hypothetical protein